MASGSRGNLVTGSIANLIGGVSQQPWNVRMPSQAEEQINCHSTITEFMRRRPALRVIKEIASPDGSDNFTVLAIDKGVSSEQYVALFGKGGIKVYDLNGVEQTVNLTDSGRQYLGQLNEAVPDLRFCTIKDYTFCTNRQVLVSMSKTEAVTRTPECVVFVKQASYQTTYKLTLDGKTYSVTTPDGLYEEGTTPPELSANKILNDLAYNFLYWEESVAVEWDWLGNPTRWETVKHSRDVWDIQINGSSMWVRKKDNNYFTYAVSDSRSNTHIVAFRDKIDKMTDLPLVAPEGMLLRITGDASTVLDDYYVVFTPEEGTSGFVKGTWKETVSPTSNNKLDSATMPHALIRRKEGVFSFEPVEWAERKAGDEETNPAPSFVGKTINNVLFYRNRLAFLSGDNVIMSEANEFFNFFLTTATTAVDSDPIDVAASGTKDAFLYGSAIYNGGLVLFSNKGQFKLEHDTVLSNSTVSLTPVTEFESSDRVLPQSSGKTIFFTTDRGRWIGIREYISFDSDTLESNDATDISAHVPRYIPGKIADLQCSTNEDILLVRSTSEKDAVWVYKYFWDGNNKAQSAWYKWKMAGIIHSNLFFNTEVYCVMQYDGRFFLEIFSFEPSHKDDGEDFEFCLDRKMNESQLIIGDYDPISKTTDVTVPYVDDRIILVTRSAGDLPAGAVLPIEERKKDDDGNTILKVKGQLTADGKGKIPTRLFAGVPFESSYLFTTIGIRNQNNTAVTTGRLQLRSLSLNLYRTGYICARVKPKGRSTFENIFTGKKLGEVSSTIGQIPIYTGQIKVPVLSRNDMVDITVMSSSYLPFSLVNADWEGFYSARSSRV